MRVHHFTRLIATVILTLAFSLSLTASTDAKQTNDGHSGRGYPFTRIIVFGDSLSDTGNFYSLTGLPPEPYFEGRGSNGYIWIDYLARAMDVDSVVNYAYFGATTGRENENDIPGVVEFPG